MLGRFEERRLSCIEIKMEKHSFFCSMELLLLYCMRMTELYQVDEKYLIDREEETKMMNIWRISEDRNKSNISLVKFILNCRKNIIKMNI